MSRSLPVTGLLLALTLGLAGASAGLVGTSASAAPDRKIWGVVVDGKGRPVLDVLVTAVDEDGEIVSSAFSYEGGVGADSPRRGYFELFPTANGTYTVTLRKKGFATKRFTEVEIVRGQRVQGLGDVGLLHVSTTVAKLVKKSITVGSRGKVKVAVTPAGEKPTGDVEVTSGKKIIGSGELKAKDKGQLTITLKKLDKGSHDLKVSYDGSKFHKGSTSDKLTLDVKAPRKNRQVPNARSFVG